MRTARTLGTEGTGETQTLLTVTGDSEGLTQRGYKSEILQHHMEVQASLSRIQEAPFCPREVHGHILKGHLNLSELIQMNLGQSVSQTLQTFSIQSSPHSTCPQFRVDNPLSPRKDVTQIHTGECRHTKDPKVAGSSRLRRLCTCSQGGHSAGHPSITRQILAVPDALAPKLQGSVM